MQFLHCPGHSWQDRRKPLTLCSSLSACLPAQNIQRYGTYDYALRVRSRCVRCLRYLHVLSVDLSVYSHTSPSSFQTRLEEVRSKIAAITGYGPAAWKMSFGCEARSLTPLMEKLHQGFHVSCVWRNDGLPLEAACRSKACPFQRIQPGSILPQGLE